jgi:hypothetical protein
VADGVDVDAVVGDGFEEGVAGQLLGQRHGDRPSAHDVARLTGMGVAAPVGAQITDDHAVGSFCAPGPLALEHLREGVVGMGASRLVTPFLLGLAAQAVGFGVEAIDEGDADFG